MKRIFYGVVIPAVLIRVGSQFFPLRRTKTINFVDVTPATMNAPVIAAAADETTTRVVAAAEVFLATLDDGLRGKVLFAFDDNKQRSNWSNLPTGLVQCSGLRMGDLSQQQRDAVYAVLATTLSLQGYQRVLDQMAGAMR